MSKVRFQERNKGTYPSDPERLLYLMFRLLPSQKRYGLLTNISLCAITREKFVRLNSWSISWKRYKSKKSCFVSSEVTEFCRPIYILFDKKQ